MLPLLLFLSPWKSLFPSEAQTVHTIVIEAMQFKPPFVRVRAGDTVVWKNTDLVAHTVTASDKSFDSGAIEPGLTWLLHVVTPGEKSYTCAFHPQMKGTLEVE